MSVIVFPYTIWMWLNSIRNWFVYRTNSIMYDVQRFYFCRKITP